MRFSGTVSMFPYRASSVGKYWATKFDPVGERSKPRPALSALL
jgi:hypothetical protein